MRPIFDDLKKLWTIAYSRSALLEADRWLDKMDAVSSDRDLTSALVCAVIAAYGRPFTQSRVSPGQRIIPLGNVSPPAHLLTTHRDLLDMRNKVIGHKDATPAPGHTETPNILLLNFDNNGFDLHTSITVEMDRDTRQKVKSLCSHFVAHCDQEFDSFVQKYTSELSKIKPGAYEVSVSEGPNDWIRPRQINRV
jgi:hypothetical protein